MIIPDTSIWIEFFRGHENYFSRMANLLEAEKVLALPWIFGELLQGALNQREIKIILQFWNELPKLSDVSCSLAWIEAGTFSQKNGLLKHGVGLIDAAILTAALKRRALVWTLDQKLQNILKGERLLMV